MGIGAIGMAGISIAGAFLFGDFGSTFGRLLASTLVIGWYGFMLYLVIPEEESNTFAQTTLGIAALVALIGLSTGLTAIWGSDLHVDENLVKTAFASGAWSAGVAWITQLYMRMTQATLVRWATSTTSGFLIIAIAVLTALIWGETDPSGLVRLFAATGVLGVAGTFVLPLLRRAKTSPSPEITSG